MLKKILFALTAVLCLTACDEDYTDWKAPQTNQQEEAQTIIVNVNPSVGFDLAEVTSDSVQLAEISTVLPEGFVTDSVAIDVVAPDGTVTPVSFGEDYKVSVADLTKIVEDQFGRRPEVRDVQFRASVYAWTDTLKVARICKTTDFEVKVKPVAPVLENAYYYIGVCGQDKSHPMTKEADGVYSVTVPANGGWHWFKIAPESGFGADGNFDWANEGNCICATSNDDEATEGRCVVGGNRYSWHLIEPEGAVSFTIKVDLYAMTYSITANY